MAYRRRHLDDLLDEVFPDLAAIALEGAKGVGKSATARQRAETVLALSTPAARNAIAGNPQVVGELPSPVLIDEWQLAPDVWDAVRDAVDANPTGGRFLLTGSAGVSPGARIHSGAGRIVSLAMRPFTMIERGIAEPAVSLQALFDTPASRVAGSSEVSVGDYTDEILRSGFPGIRDLPLRARGLQLDSYITRIIEHELPENGILVRRPGALRAWLASYAAATASTASYTTVLDAATAGESEKPARQTVAQYRDHLARVFILDPVEAWIPAFSPLTRLAVTPKHHLVDPALAARLVGVGKAGLLRGEGHIPSAATGTWLGALFESLVTQSVRVYADMMDATTGHLRLKDGTHEVDLIVERADRTCVAIEVKLSATATDHDVRHLHWLKKQLDDRLADMVVVNTGPFAYRRDDGVAVVPLALLGP
ncbi:ATP-binding protein [Microbacterium sp.]|uniref:ATP-binding protein n=1 Tax=Microbacterium sp. TaxID=51671 RepID=UPI003A8E89C5